MSEPVKSNLNSLSVTDEKGVARVNIAADLPDPVVEGEARHRDVKVSGIQLNDSQGNEIGGFGVIEGQRVGVLALDYLWHEAAVLYAADTPEGSQAGLVLSEKVEFKDGRFVRPHRRIELTVTEGSPSLVFKGKDGKPRLMIGLDENDEAYIKVIGKDGAERRL